MGPNHETPPVCLVCLQLVRCPLSIHTPGLCAALYCTVLHCTVLYCTVLYCMLHTPVCAAAVRGLPPLPRLQPAHVRGPVRQESPLPAGVRGVQQTRGQGDHQLDTESSHTLRCYQVSIANMDGYTPNTFYQCIAPLRSVASQTTYLHITLQMSPVERKG